MAEARNDAAEKEEELRLTEAEIAVHWKEESYLSPNSKFIGQANLNDPATLERAMSRT